MRTTAPHLTPEDRSRETCRSFTIGDGRGVRTTWAVPPGQARRADGGWWLMGQRNPRRRCGGRRREFSGDGGVAPGRPVARGGGGGGSPSPGRPRGRRRRRRGTG